MKSLSRVRLFATPWTVAYQAPPSVGFSRQGYWSGLPFPSPGRSSQPRDGGLKPWWMRKSKSLDYQPITCLNMRMWKELVLIRGKTRGACELDPSAGTKKRKGQEGETNFVPVHPEQLSFWATEIQDMLSAEARKPGETYRNEQIQPCALATLKTPGLSPSGCFSLLMMIVPIPQDYRED